MSDTATTTAAPAGSSMLKFPFQNGDAYLADVKGQTIELNKFGTPQLMLEVTLKAKLADKYRPEGASTPLGVERQVTKMIRLTLDPSGEYLDKTLSSLAHYGYDVNAPLESLSLDHPHPFKLVGKTVVAGCQVKDGKNGPMDIWWLNKPTGDNKKVNFAELKAFCQEKKDLIQASRDKIQAETPFDN